MNWSPLQNIENVSFRIIADNAVFPSAGTNDDYFLNGHEWRKESYKSVLHYGEPVRIKNVLEVPLHKLQDSELYVMLTFGGKNSPSKSSEYTLNLSKLNIDSMAESAVISRNENQLFKDLQDKKGVTKQDFLNKLLDR